MCRLVDQGIRLGEHRPHLLRLLQGTHEQALQFSQCGRKAPLFPSTRAMESEIWVSRSCSLSPDAAKGGRPSSVSATRHRQTVAMHGLGLLILLLFQPPLDGTDPTHLLLEL